MIALRFVLITALLVLTVWGQQTTPQSQSVVPDSCPVTTPPDHPFTPPGSHVLSGENDFWVGTEKLWTALNTSGTWEWEPHKPGHEHQIQPLTRKIFWMSVDYDWRKEPHPELKVTGRRLDGTAPPLLVGPMTHAIVGSNAAMLSGIYVPTPGCWEITGDYKGEKLSFVVWLQPATNAGQ